MPGRVVGEGEDHRQRRVTLVRYARRETFGREAELREYMTNLRNRLALNILQDLV